MINSRTLTKKGGLLSNGPNAGGYYSVYIFSIFFVTTVKVRDIITITKYKNLFSIFIFKNCLNFLNLRKLNTN